MPSPPPSHLVSRIALKNKNCKKLLLLFCTLNCSENSSKQVAFDLIGTDCTIEANEIKLFTAASLNVQKYHKYIRASL